MDFEFDKTHKLFQQMIRTFAENEVKPIAAEVDEQERFPEETVAKMAKLGIMKWLPELSSKVEWMPESR
jgi:Acyl-CoA dehydrogenases